METDSDVVYSEEVDEFKSYYVVWKPTCTSLIMSDSPGLNRTMQYGNPPLKIYTDIAFYV